jgi:DNA polymerase-3 subunit gamma/tau
MSSPQPPYGQQPQQDPFGPYGTPQQALPPQPAAQDARPAKKKGNPAVGFAIMGVIAVIIAGGAYALLSGGSKPAASSSRAAGAAAASSPAAPAGAAAASSPAAPAGAAAASSPAAPAAPLSCAEQVAAWNSGPGWTWSQKVNAELGKISTAASARDYAALGGDGPFLGAAAKVAELYPLPACADPHGSYVAAMNDFQAASADLGSGDMAGASAQITLGGNALEALARNMRTLTP